MIWSETHLIKPHHRFSYFCIADCNTEVLFLQRPLLEQLPTLICGLSPLLLLTQSIHDFAVLCSVSNTLSISFKVRRRSPTKLSQLSTIRRQKKIETFSNSTCTVITRRRRSSQLCRVPLLNFCTNLVQSFGICLTLVYAKAGPRILGKIITSISATSTSKYNALNGM